MRSYSVVVRHHRGDIFARPERLVSMADDKHFGRHGHRVEPTAVADVLGAAADLLAQIRHRANPLDATDHHRNRLLPLLDTAIAERLSALVVSVEYAEKLARPSAVLSANGIFAGRRLHGVGREFGGRAGGVRLVRAAAELEPAQPMD